MKQSIKTSMVLVTKEKSACYSRKEDSALDNILYGLEPTDFHFV